MNVISKIKSTKEKVVNYLKTKVEYRDNDERLCCAYLWNEIKEKGLDTQTLLAHELLSMYASGKLTPLDIILRARRKAQEEHPELRGKKWAQRHREEKEVRENINERPESFPNM